MVANRRRPVAVQQKPDRNSARTEAEVVAALVAEGKLIPASKPGPFKRFNPLKIRGEPFSRTIIEDRR